MTVTEIFYEEVKKAEKIAQEAGRKFNNDKREIERLGRTSFKLFDSNSGRIMNEFAK